MAIFLNYYPCTYGDSLASMFLGYTKSRKNNIISSKTNYFKLLDFYNLNLADRIQKLSSLDNNQIYSCHRQNAVDFGQEHRVVSIFPDVLDFLPNRVIQVHIEQFGKQLNNPLVEKLKNKVPMYDLIKFDCCSWAKTNILKSDTILPFSFLQNQDKLKLFCKDNNFTYNQDCVGEILNDIKRYQ